MLRRGELLLLGREPLSLGARRSLLGWSLQGQAGSASGRRWRMGSFAALWISMSACIPTYMLASSLIGEGMNWWQALITILLGNTIVPRIIAATF